MEDGKKNKDFYRRTKMISAEQFAEWKTHPVTKEVFAQVRVMVEAIKDQLASGDTIDYTAEVTHGQTSRAVGQLYGLNQLLNISFDDKEIQEEVNEQSGY